MPNFWCGRTCPLSRRGELGGEGDAVALDGEVDVEAGLAEQQVAHGAADEVAAAHAGGDGLDVAEQLVQAQLSERAGEVHGREAPQARAAGSPATERRRHHADHSESSTASATSPAGRAVTTGSHPTSSWARRSATRSSGVVRPHQRHAPPSSRP